MVSGGRNNVGRGRNKAGRGRNKVGRGRNKVGRGSCRKGQIDVKNDQVGTGRGRKYPLVPAPVSGQGKTDQNFTNAPNF